MSQGGYIFQNGVAPETSSVLSTRFLIFTQQADLGRFFKLGVTSNFSISESKTVDPVRGLGYGDQIAELVPGVTQPMDLSVTRTCLYLQNIMQAFGYNAGISGSVRSLRQHRWPFDVKTEIVFSQLATDNPNTGTATLADIPNEGGLNNTGNPGLLCVATIYEGCWMESYSSDFVIDTAAVAEQCSIKVTDIYDTAGSVYGFFTDGGLGPNDITGQSLLYTS